VMTEELASQRDEQASSLASGFASQLSAADQTPVLVCGDFNCPSHQDWTSGASSLHYGKVIAWPATTAMTNAGLTDTYRERHSDPVSMPGNTWSSIYVGSEPQDRIDFIYYKGRKINPVASSVFNTQVEQTLNQDGDSTAPVMNNTWPTDHRAVLTEFRVTPTDANQNGLPDYWEQLYFGAGSGQGALDDIDHDGEGNLMEYSVGSSPVTAASCNRPQWDRLGNDYVISYHRHAGGLEAGASYSAAGIRYQVERSPDLQTWISAGDWLAPEGSPTFLSDDMEAVMMRITPPASTAQQFFRLTVTPE
jgi:hypothetical protein